MLCVAVSINPVLAHSPDRLFQHYYLLLASFLFAEVSLNVTITVLLNQMIGGIFAIIGSTLAIVIFVEIVPMAVCCR